MSGDLFGAMACYFQKTQLISRMILPSKHINTWVALRLCLWLLISRVNDVYLLAGLKQELVQLVQ